MEHDGNRPGFFEGPPQTMFAFGFACGIALAAIVFMLMGSTPSFGALAANTDTIGGVDNNVDPNANQPVYADAPAVTKQDWVRGDLDKAKVVMVEYSDFQCPYCSRHHPVMQQLVDEYKGDVAWVYRHFPLTSIHPQATPAAEAAECAGELGGNEAFWAMADALFENQTVLGQATYERLAGEQGLNAGKFSECLSSGKFAAKVSSQQSGGAAAGVTGTPGTFVNGQLLPGALPVEQFRAIIDAQL